MTVSRNRVGKMSRLGPLRQTMKANTAFPCCRASYFLEFVDSAERLFTASRVGNDAALDSDVIEQTNHTGVFAIEFGTLEDLSYDAGLIPRLGVVGDFAFIDVNRDGLQDDGDVAAARRRREPL